MSYYDPNNPHQAQYDQGAGISPQPYVQSQYHQSNMNSYQGTAGNGPDAYSQNPYDNTRNASFGYSPHHPQHYQLPAPEYGNYPPQDQSQYNAPPQPPSYGQQPPYESTPAYGHNTWDNPPPIPHAPSYSSGNSTYYNQPPPKESFSSQPPPENYHPTQEMSSQPYPPTDQSMPAGDRGYNTSYQQYPNPDPNNPVQQYPGPGSNTSGPSYGHPDPNQVEGERGILGAVGGAVAGGYAGHQIHHGFLGAVGGAIAGHKLEEHFKDKKKEKKKKHHHGHGRRSSSSSGSSSSSSDDEKKKKKKYGAAALAAGGGAAAYAHHQHQNQHQQQQQPHHKGHGHPRTGNFSATCEQITIDRDYDLIASCRDTHHQNRLSSISLNDCLANVHGRLEWQRGGGFRSSARYVKLVDHGDRGKLLEAELRDNRGGWNVSRINLDERIVNNDGDLQFVD